MEPLSDVRGEINRRGIGLGDRIRIRFSDDSTTEGVFWRLSDIGTIELESRRAADPDPRDRPGVVSIEKIAEAEPLGPMPETEAQWFFYEHASPSHVGAAGERERRRWANLLADAETWARGEIDCGRLEFTVARKDPNDFSLPGDFVAAPDFWVHARRPATTGEVLLSAAGDPDTPEERREAKARLAARLRDEVRAEAERNQARQDPAYLEAHGDPDLLAAAVVEAESMAAMDELIRLGEQPALNALLKLDRHRVLPALLRQMEADVEPESHSQEAQPSFDACSFPDLESLQRRYALQTLFDDLRTSLAHGDSTPDTKPQTSHPQLDALDDWVREHRGETRDADGLALPTWMMDRLQVGGFLSPRGELPRLRRGPRRTPREILEQLTEPAWLTVGLVGVNPDQSGAVASAVASLAHRGKDSPEPPDDPSHVVQTNVGTHSMILATLDIQRVPGAGQTFAALCARFDVPTERVIVVHEDPDLPLSDVRINPGGAGRHHPEIHAITQALGSPDYMRVRVGVGRAPARDSSADATRAQAVEPPSAYVVERIADAVRLIITQGAPKAMSTWNAR